MTALTIVAIILLGIVGLINLTVVVATKDEAAGLGLLNLVPIVLAIVTLSISLS